MLFKSFYYNIFCSCTIKWHKRYLPVIRQHLIHSLGFRQLHVEYNQLWASAFNSHGRICAVRRRRASWRHEASVRDAFVIARQRAVVDGGEAIDLAVADFRCLTAVHRRESHQKERHDHQRHKGLHFSSCWVILR